MPFIAIPKKRCYNYLRVELMIRYEGSIVMDEFYTELVSFCDRYLWCIEQVYIAVKNKLQNYSKTVPISSIPESESKTADEIFEILHKNGTLKEFYKQNLFCRLLSDFLLYMQESISNVKRLNPQVALTLARKPLIDDIYYLQHLLVNSDNAITLVFSDKAKEKDWARVKDETISDQAFRQLGYPGKRNIFFEMRCGDGDISLLTFCNKASHIVMSRGSKQNHSISGELNFVFIKDEEILNYTQYYCKTIPWILSYVTRIICKIHENLVKAPSFDDLLDSLDEKLAIAFKRTPGGNE